MRKFIADNLALILSSDDRKEAIRIRKKEFFQKNGLKSSDNFSFRDIAFQTLRHFIDNSKLKTEDEIKKFVKASSFLTNYITNNDIEALTGLIKPLQSPILTTDDLKKMNQDDYIKQKEQQLIDRAKDEVQKGMEAERKKITDEMNAERNKLEELRISTEKRVEEVMKLQSQLDLLPSVINPEDYIKYEETEVKPVSKQPFSWWQKLDLTEDPFPTKWGLTRIPESKYEKVVVTTSILSKYLDIIQDNPQMLYGKTILIHGIFGAGKTTFLQYVSYKLAPHNILPFIIVLDPIGDIDIIRQNFYTETFNQICQSMKKRGLVDPRPQGLQVDRNTMAELLIELARNSQIDGFVLMIDGLHKAESTIEASLEFVKQLQNFHEYMENRGINLCIFIAGSPLWIRRITQNNAYSGSFFRLDEIPPISFENAYALLQNRIQAYKGSEDLFIDKDSIRFAYDSVYKNEGGNVTFRSFLDYIIPRLEKGDFEGVGLSAAIDIEIVRKIDKELLNSPIKESYTYLKGELKEHRKLRQSCAFVLLEIYKNKYLEEWDREFDRNKGAFYTLKHAHLIQKIRGRRGIGWSLSTEFLPVLDNLMEQGYPPSIVFKSFSIDSTIPLTINLDNDVILETGKDYLAKWESEWPEIVTPIKAFLDAHKKMLEKLDGAPDYNICVDCKNSLLNLINCTQIVCNNTLSPIEWLDSTWLDIPILSIIKSVLLQDQLNTSDRMEYYSRYCSSARSMLDILDQLLDSNRLIKILSSKNGNEEKRCLMKAAIYFNNGDLEKAVEEINSKLESRIRTIFHLVFSLHYGNDYIKYLPTYLQTKISQLPDRGFGTLKRKKDTNLFYHLSRSEYPEIVNDRRNWYDFFEKIFSPYTRPEIYEMLKITFTLDDRLQHRDRIDYFRNAREEIRQSIINADVILYSLAEALRLAIEPTGFSHVFSDNNHLITVSFRALDNIHTSYQYQIPSIIEDEIANRIVRMKQKINFVNELAICTTFNGTFSEIFITLAILNEKGLIEINDSPESRMYLEISPRITKTG